MLGCWRPFIASYKLVSGRPIKAPTMPRSRTPFTTTVHHYKSPHTPGACAYEVGLPGAKNAYVFIGGLGDGPHTVPYPRAVAGHLESLPDLSYSVFEIRMKSSFEGWGLSSLVQDAEEISALVQYLRGIGRQTIVLNGHSTGCQVQLITRQTLSMCTEVLTVWTGHYGVYITGPLWPAGSRGRLHSAGSCLRSRCHSA